METTQTTPNDPIDRPSKPENIKPEEDELKRFTGGVVTQPIVVRAKDEEEAEQVAREQLYDLHGEIGMNVRRSDE